MFISLLLGSTAGNTFFLVSLLTLIFCLLSHISFLAMGQSESSGTRPRRSGNLRNRIAELLVTSDWDNKDFLPESHLSSLMTKEEITMEMPGATTELVDFVHNKARKVFATILLLNVKEEIVPIMASFHRHKFNDTCLPIGKMFEDKTCKVKDLWDCSESCENGRKAHCAHPPFLDVFHHPPWEAYDVKLFYTTQWTFLAPVFEISKMEPDICLDRDHILPFTFVDDGRDGLEGQFGSVVKARLRADHQKATFTV